MAVPADDRFVERSHEDVATVEPPRTVADPREREEWFLRLAQAKQDELRTVWAAHEAHAEVWEAGQSRFRRVTMRDAGLLMVLVLLLSNPASIGFLGYLRILVGGMLGGALVGWLAERWRAERALTAVLGGLGFYLTQSVLFAGGSFVALSGAVVAGTVFMANGVIREFRTPGG